MDTVDATPTIAVRPRLVRRVLVVTVAFLIVATYVAQLLKDHHHALTLAQLFDSDVKANFPTGFKIFALTASALTIWMVARHARATHDRWARQWLFLAGVVGFLTIDETAWLHHAVSAFLDGHTGWSGALKFSWAVIYLGAAALAAAYLWPFFWALPRPAQIGFAAAGVLFGGGSGVLEMVKGVTISNGHDDSLRLMLVAATSDSLELIGLSILLMTALRELMARTDEVRVVLSPEPDGTQRVGRDVDGDAAPAAVDRDPLVGG